MFWMVERRRLYYLNLKKKKEKKERKKVKKVFWERLKKVNR